MRASTQRLTAAAESVLAPEERLTATGVGWAAQMRSRVPLLFLGRRQHWLALTDRRLLVFARHWRGPSTDDLVLAKRYPFFTLEKVHPHRLLYQLRVRGANGARMVLEFRPGHHAVGAELAARLTRALPAAEAPTPYAVSTVAAGPSTAPGTDPGVDRDTAAAFWGSND